jgi:hypothetical protein
LSPVQDQTLENISKELTDKIAGIDPDDVRYNLDNRKSIAETTESILDRMKGFI